MLYIEQTFPKEGKIIMKNNCIDFSFTPDTLKNKIKN